MHQVSALSPFWQSMAILGATIFIILAILLGAIAVIEYHMGWKRIDRHRD